MAYRAMRHPPGRCALGAVAPPAAFRALDPGWAGARFPAARAERAALLARRLLAAAAEQGTENGEDEIEHVRPPYNACSVALATPPCCTYCTGRGRKAIPHGARESPHEILTLEATVRVGGTAAPPAESCGDRVSAGRAAVPLHSCSPPLKRVRVHRCAPRISDWARSGAAGGRDLRCR